MMKCVELAKTPAPSSFNQSHRSRATPAQSAFERFATRGNSDEVEAWFVRKTKSSFTQNVGNRVATLGSDGTVYCRDDDGIFSAILTAYNNHWKLRTSPDDWWFCVIKRVADGIDKNAGVKAVRKMFVDHEGKKTLRVEVPTTCIYDVDYASFFAEISAEIAKNIKAPKYVDAVTADFTTTSPTMKIVSQITIMSSVQKYFKYEMMTLCGIPAIEMLGTESDWMKLEEKLAALKKILKPISREIWLFDDWWSHAEKVFKELVNTYRGSPDKDWWDKIINYDGSDESGQTPGYFGWLAEFLEGTTRKVPVGEFTSGLLSVPLTISSPSGEVIDTAALVAGMLGYTLHEETVPVVQPYQGWCLLLPENSPLRSKTAA